MSDDREVPPRSRALRKWWRRQLAAYRSRSFMGKLFVWAAIAGFVSLAVTVAAWVTAPSAEDIAQRVLELGEERQARSEPGQPITEEMRQAVFREAGEEFGLAPGSVAEALRQYAETTTDRLEAGRLALFAGDTVKARSELESSLRAARSAAKTAREREVLSLLYLGQALLAEGRFQDASERLDEAVALDSENPEVLGWSGSALLELGAFSEAQRRYKKAAELFAKSGPKRNLRLGASLHNLGYSYYGQGAFTEALPWFERAVAALEKGDFHGRIDYERLGSSLYQVGMCHAQQGAFAEALPWFARAVAALEKGDVHGRDHFVRLGASLHVLGLCHLEQGAFAEALPWFIRAVSAKEKGDVHGRVDHESLSMSLHEVGICFLEQGDHDEAVPWFERAVEASEKGDVHGRVDHRSLGESLHHVGYSYSSQGAFSEALPWFERAVAAFEKGDVHGRVDHLGLGASLHEVGMSYVKQGAFAEALPWFERSVAAFENVEIRGLFLEDSLEISREALSSDASPLEVPWPLKMRAQYQRR